MRSQCKFAYSWYHSLILIDSRTLWAAVLLCTAATQNAAGLQATRFFLGFMEAAVAPGFGIITSMWYKRSEQPLRMGAWFMGNVCSGLFGALLAYAIGHITGIEPWRVNLSSTCKFEYTG